MREKDANCDAFVDKNVFPDAEGNHKMFACYVPVTN